ncbi:ABC transporter permease [Acidobacteriota bacterium]
MSYKDYNFPQACKWLLAKILNSAIRDGALQDFDEQFSFIAAKRSKAAAFLWYWFQVIVLLPSYILDKLSWSITMFKNYLKTALRNIIKYKAYSFINIAGLALGMACCLLISLWVLDELSYDKFHENAPHLYRVEENQYYSGRRFHVAVTPFPLAPALAKEIPEIKDATRYARAGGILLRYKEKSFFENSVRAVDPSFLRMFTFPFLKGNKETALSDPQSLIISEEIAAKYFGDEHPLNKTITINNQEAFKVTGVLKKVPNNSYLQFDILLPYEYLRKIGATDERWGSNSVQTFAQLYPNTTSEQANKKGFRFYTHPVKRQSDRIRTDEFHALAPA